MQTDTHITLAHDHSARTLIVYNYKRSGLYISYIEATKVHGLSFLVTKRGKLDGDINSAMTNIATLRIKDSSAVTRSDTFTLEYMKEFPSGPLDVYRRKASFEWKRMRLFLDGEDILRFKVRILSTILFALSEK